MSGPMGKLLGYLVHVWANVRIKYTAMERTLLLENSEDPSRRFGYVWILKTSLKPQPDVTPH
jgi:hypothetical protein